jgi:hypothetical protein
MPHTMFFRKPSSTPRSSTSDALGMQAPAARLALITLPVDVILCIGSLFLSRPSVKIAVRCTCSHWSVRGIFLDMARLLNSQRSSRCVASSSATSAQRLRVMPSVIVRTVVAVLSVGFPLTSLGAWMPSASVWSGRLRAACALLEGGAGAAAGTAATGEIPSGTAVAPDADCGIWAWWRASMAPSVS